jgi:hypothetical protein
MPVKGGAVAVDYDPFADAPLQRVVAATEAQREIWLAATLEPRACWPNEAVSLHFDGCSMRAMIRALHAVLARHEALRARQRRRQQFCIAAQIELRRRRSAASSCAGHRRRPASRGRESTLDLTAGPLLRADCCASATPRICLCWPSITSCDMADIDCDLSAPVGMVYAHLPTPIRLRFRDARGATRNRGYATTRPGQALCAGARAAETSVDPRASGQRSSPRMLQDPLRACFAAAPQARGASLFASLLTMFGVLLQRISGQNDLVVGIPAAGQASTDHPGLVGHAVNVLPLRLQLDPEATLGDVIGKLRGDLLDAFEHKRSTLGTLLRRLALSRDPGRLPLVAVLFNLDPGSMTPLGFSDLAARFAGVPLRERALRQCRAVGPALRPNSANTDSGDDRALAGPYQTCSVILPATWRTRFRRCRCCRPAELRALQPGQHGKPLVSHEPDSPVHERTPDCAGADVRWTYAQLIAPPGAIAAARNTASLAVRRHAGSWSRHGCRCSACRGGALHVPLDPARFRESLDFTGADAGLALLTENAPCRIDRCPGPPQRAGRLDRGPGRCFRRRRERRCRSGRLRDLHLGLDRQTERRLRTASRGRQFP